jgi:CRISPR-associated protein Csb2
MSFLSIQVRFIAHSYSGIRFREDRREELDWPPSPARLHEALLSSALLGVVRTLPEREAAFAAFRWFERLPPPEIRASAQDESLRTQPRIAIPQNNPKKSKLDLKSALLAPTKRAVSLSGDPLEVCFHWPIERSEKTGTHLEVLADAAARLSYFGRAEDRVEVSLSIVDEPPARPLVRWQPQTTGHTTLWVPKAGTTDGLEERHHEVVPPRQSKRPAQRWMKAVHYSDGGPQSMQPVAVAIFQLFPDNDDPDATALSCDAESAGRWREFMRHLVVRIASNEDNWDDSRLTAELLTGHSNPGQKATRPHLAIMPVPTFNQAHTADGRVRRIALMGYAAPEVSGEAVSIYETLFNALDDLVVSADTPFQRNGKALPVRLRRSDEGIDAVWRQLIGRSRVWCSLTPVAISRGFKVPKFHSDGRPLSENERHRRKLYEWSSLLRDSLKHIQLPVALANACSIEMSPTPFVAKTQRAERYRSPGENSVLTHVRLEFPAKISGPLILGDRRYLGLGLFVPLVKAEEALQLQESSPNASMRNRLKL